MGATMAKVSKNIHQQLSVHQLNAEVSDTPRGKEIQRRLRKRPTISQAEVQALTSELSSLIDEAGRAVWTWRPTEDGKLAQVRDIYVGGTTNQREIAKQAGIGVSTVNRKIQQLREKGEVP